MGDEKEKEREDERKQRQREVMTELENEVDVQSSEHTQLGLTRQSRPFILWWLL